MKDPLLKLNAMHKFIMCEISGESVIKAGVLHCGWTREEHIQHTSDSIKSQIEIFNRQVLQVIQYLRDENVDLIKRSLEMYEKDREKLRFNLQNDQVDKALFGVIKEYMDSLNDLILALTMFLAGN